MDTIINAEEMIMIPVLINHDQTEVIGKCTNDGTVYIHENLIPLDNIFDVFGNSGIRVDEIVLVNGIEYVRKLKIVEFSVTSAPKKIDKKEFLDVLDMMYNSLDDIIQDEWYCTDREGNTDLYELLKQYAEEKL